MIKVVLIKRFRKFDNKRLREELYENFLNCTGVMSQIVAILNSIESS